MSTFSQGSRPLRLNEGEELGDELCLIRQVFMMYDHRREGRLTVQEVSKVNCEGWRIEGWGEVGERGNN